MTDSDSKQSAASNEPQRFEVTELRHESSHTPIFALFCHAISCPVFDPDFIKTKYPLHKDLIDRDGVRLARASMNRFTTTLIILLVPLLAPLLIVAAHATGNATFTCLTAIIILLPFAARYKSQVETGWKRYASWVYENAEPQNAIAQCSTNSRVITVTLQNGQSEAVFARNYGYSADVLNKLLEPRQLSVFLDRPENPTVTILEIEQNRIWCYVLPRVTQGQAPPT